MKKGLKVIKTDGGICSQILFAALGKYYEDNGFKVKYDISFFKDYGLDVYGKFCRNYDINKAFPNLKLELANDEEIKKAKLNKNYIDYYSEKRYYSLIKYRDYFKKNFKPEGINQNLLNDIKNRNACAIHVRRGDLANSTGGSYGYPPSVNYFIKSINLVKALCPEVKFYFFSDEPNWIEENIIPKLNDVSFEICKENGSDKGYLDLFLMSKCKYIISSIGSLGIFAKILSEKSYLIMYKAIDYVCENIEDVIIINDLHNIPEEAKKISKVLQKKKKNSLLRKIVKNIFSIYNDYQNKNSKKIKIVKILGLKIKITKKDKK